MSENGKAVLENNNTWSFGSIIKSILGSVRETEDLVVEAEEQRFFPVSKSLIRKLMSDTKDAYERDLERTEIEVIENDEEFEALLNQDFSFEPVSGIEVDKETEQFQQRLTEEIYFYLGFLSKEFAGYEENISFEEVMTYELGRVLSLPSEHQSVLMLTTAFVEWIKNSRTFTTGWGAITYSFDDDVIILKALDENDSVNLRVESAKVSAHYAFPKSSVAGG